MIVKSIRNNVNEYTVIKLLNYIVNMSITNTTINNSTIDLTDNDTISLLQLIISICAIIILPLLWLITIYKLILEPLYNLTYINNISDSIMPYIAYIPFVILMLYLNWLGLSLFKNN